MKHAAVTPCRRPSICSTSIAAFLAAAGFSPGDTFHVDLGDTLTVSTAISGNLHKTGLGSLILQGPQTYAGPTTVAAGALVVDGTSFPMNSAITIFGHTVQGTTAGQLVLAGAYAPQTFTFAGGGLQISGAGPGGNGLALLSVGNNMLTGGIVTASTVTTRLGSGFGMMTINGLTLGTGQTTIVTGNLTANSTLTGISGPGTLQKQGTATLILTGSNTNTGIVDLNGGFVRVSAAANLGTSTAANAINFNNATLDVRTDTPDFSGKRMSIASSNGTVNLDRAAGGSGLNQSVVFSALTLAGNRNLTLNTRNGYGLTVGTAFGGGNGQNTLTNNGNGPLTIDGNLWNNNDGTARTLTFGAAFANSGIVVNGSILASNVAAHGVAKTGTGTLTIAGVASTYSGITDIQNGAVVIRQFGAIGNSSVSANVQLGNAGNTGTLTYLGAAFTGTGETSSRNFLLNGTTGGGRINASQAGSAPTPLILTGNVSVLNPSTSAKTFTLGGSSPLDNELSGSIVNGSASTVSVTKTDAGTWVLSGTNTYSGNTTINGGTLKLRANGAASTVLNDASSIVFNADAATQRRGGTLEFIGPDGVTATESLGPLFLNAGASTVRVTPGVGGHAHLVFAILAGIETVSASVNFVTPSPLDTITLTGQPSDFVRAETYFNGADFAYSEGGVLRASRYGNGAGGGGTDIGFVTTSAGFYPYSHHEITGSFISPSASMSSLKIAGSHTVTMTGSLVIDFGGILVTGGNAAITGGNISTGSFFPTTLAVRVDGAGDSLLLDSPILSTATNGLTKNGAGTLILSAVNNQRGATNINEGTVRLAGAGRLSSIGGAVVIAQGAVLDLGGINSGNSVGALSGAGTVINSGSVAATLSVGNGPGAGTFTGSIEDGANRLSVIKAGTAAQTMSGLSSYTGATTFTSTGLISASTLANIGQPSAIGRGDDAGNLTNAASLVFAGADTTAAMGGISYTGGATVSIDRLFTFGSSTVAGAGGRIQANGANNATLVFNNSAPIAYTPGASIVNQTVALGGASTGDNMLGLQLVNPSSATLRVHKQDAGTWHLGNNANTYTGTTMISGGRLVAIDGLSLPAASPLVLANGVFQSSGNFTRAVSAAPTPGSGGVHWAGTTGAVGGGFAADGAKLTVALTPASLTWGGGGFLSNTGTAAASGVLILNSTTALAEVELQNNINLGSVPRTVQVDDNSTTTTDFATLTGVLSGSGAGTGAGGIVKTGVGVLQLLGANTYPGATQLLSGTLYVQTFGNSASASSNLGAGSAVLRLGGGTLAYVGAGEASDRALALTARITILDSSGSGPIFLNGTFDLPGTTGRTLTLQALNSDANELASVLTNPPAGFGATTVSVTKAQGGTWILSGDNSQTGTTTVTAGNLGFGHNSAAGFGPLTIQNGNVFADGGDRILANNVNLANNATSGVIGVNSLTFTGPVTVGTGGNSTVNNNLVAGKQFENAGNINLGDAITNRTLAFGGGGQTVVSGVIGDHSSAATILALALNSGTLVLAGTNPNTYSGNTTINGGALRLAGSSGDQIPDGFSKGNVVFGNTTLAALFDLNGRSETINGLTGTSSGTKAIGNSSASAATLTFGNNDGPVDFNGSITNSGGGPLSIVKMGAAAGVLSGATLNYTGTTTVLAGGSLHFPNAIPSATSGLTVAGNAGFSILNGVGAPLPMLALLNLGVGGGNTTLALDLGPVSDTITATGAATTAGVVNFDLNGLPGFGAGTYNLLVAPGGGLLGPTYGLSNVPGGFTYTINQANTLISLTATSIGPSAAYYWTGDQDSSWSTFNAGNTNWADAAGADPGAVPGPADTVVFSSTVAGPVGPAVPTTLDGNVNIDNLQFNGSPASSAVTIAQGTTGTLTIAPAAFSNGLALPDNAGTVTISAPVALGADQTWTVGSAGTLRPLLTVSGAMSGTGNLIKAGAGTATLTGTNTRTGRTIINGGVLNINSEAALGADPGALTADQLTINGGTLRLAATTAIDDTNRGVTLGAGATIDTAAGNGTIASVIAGGGDLSKMGGFLLVLTGANTYSGPTTINAGTLRAAHNTAVGAGAVSLNGTGTVLEIINGLNVANPIHIADNGNEKTLRLLAGATSGTFSESITVSETASGNFRLSAGAGGTLTVSGVITETTGIPGLRKEGAGTAIFTNPGSTFRGAASVAAGVLMHGVDNLLPATTAVVVNGTGGVAATLDLNGFNQTIGALNFNGTQGAAGSVNTVQTGSGILTLNGNVTVNSTGNPTTPATLSGNVALPATRTFGVNNSTGTATDLQVSAVVTGAGGITKTGLGTVALSGANTYAGTTTITQGTVLNGANEVIPGALIVNANTAGGGATYNTGGFTETISSLTYGGSTSANTTNLVASGGGGTLIFAGDITTQTGSAGTMQATLEGNVILGSGVRTFTVADTTNAQADLLIAASLTGSSQGLVKAGLGTMQLTATNTYDGPTVINNGTLVVTGSITASPVTVNASGTLAGTGSTGPVIVNGGTLSPGASIGTLNTGSLNFVGSATFQLEIDTTQLTTDLLNASGGLTLDLANSAILTLTDFGSGFLLPDGARFTFITYTGTWNGGLFSIGGTPIADDVQPFTFGANTFTLDYNDGGQSVSLIAVPEPTATASLLGGLALLAGLRRRRRQASPVRR